MKTKRQKRYRLSFKPYAIHALISFAALQPCTINPLNELHASHIPENFQNTITVCQQFLLLGEYKKSKRKMQKPLALASERYRIIDHQIQKHGFHENSNQARFVTDRRAGGRT